MSSALTLFEREGHRITLLPESDAGEGVPTNQFVIAHDGEGMLLDPGGTKLFPKVLSVLPQGMRGAKLKYIFCSHQDPDIVASLNGWLMSTDATGLIGEPWRRFIPHFGSDKFVFDRVRGIPDGGQVLPLGNTPLLLLPAHFLHSISNFHVYDPMAKILFTGDLGVSLGQPYREVTDFAGHIRYMAGFHRRYMASNRALRAWARMVRGLEIETIAPQHGALMRGPALVQAFLSWVETVECGIDVMEDVYKLPG